ncbi:DUF6555 family protein [Pseudomonas sp. NPDC007930]|uniref:DUF6555 family protein n=1 Tax=Pseudomonas sp. NPDC007930 TaxID=3364417 RepID=UPI0036E2FE3B
MTRFKHFLITYRYKGEARSFAQKDNRMTSADAWYYASLHSGARHLYGVTTSPQSPRDLRLHAQQYGVTEVGFQEVP